MTLPVTLPPCPLPPLARRRLPALVFLVGPSRPKEHCLVGIGLLLTLIALDAWSMGNPDHRLALRLRSLHVALHRGIVAAHDSLCRHCLQRSTCHCLAGRCSPFYVMTGGQYVRVLVEVMCGCTKGRSGQPVKRQIATRVATRALPAPALALALAPVPAPVYPQPVRQRIPQPRFQHRGRFQPAPALLYNPETTVWGPPLWKVLHTLAEFSDNSPLWFDILNSLETFIPCPVCKTHFTEYKTQNPAPADHQGIVDWFFILHNIVNARTNKPLYDAAGLPKGDKTLLVELGPVIEGLSVSYPPEFIALLQQMVQSLM